MPRNFGIVLVLLSCFTVSFLAAQEKKDQKPAARAAKQPKPVKPGDDYEPGPDSKRQPNVPQGKMFDFTFDQSRVFPGTTRKITVYIPAQYKADKPACVYVALDSLGFNAPIVFDNLIHQGDMPVTIGIGVSPGSVQSAKKGENPRFNRSFEFDGLNGNLAKCVLEEILPEVEKKTTPDGLPIKLSQDPNDRCTGGGSTGGIGAFTLAWERPDAFRRVFTAVGTFVGMRGGDRYPVLIRKTEPKPIRMFMQDGSNDQWMGGPEVGDWWMSNQTVERALDFAGYQVEHAFGTGAHSGKHATQVFPDAMRFLWKDWPKPVEAGESENKFLQEILLPGEQWRAGGSDGPTPFLKEADRNVLVTNNGNQYVAENGSDESKPSDLWLVHSGGEKVKLDHGLKAIAALAMSPDGLWLAAAEAGSHWGYSFRVETDGTLSDKQRYYWFHVPDWADDSGCRAWCFDRDGKLYAATRMGVQVLDRNGRSRAILPLAAGEVTDIAFGGEKLDTLYVKAGGKVFTRRMKVPGQPPAAAPIKLPPWGAG